MLSIISISEIIRDYTEVLSTIARATGPLDNFKIVSESLKFLISFLSHKIKDLCKILYSGKNYYTASVMVPYVSMYEEDAIFNQIFEYSEFLNIRENPLITGFLNSIFFVFPNSVAHLAAIRRLFTQGIPAATYTLGGYLAGQLVIVFCVLFGIQRLVHPVLTLEPLNYFLGLVFLGRIIFSVRFENFNPLDTWNHPKYKKYFINSFLLSFCEQGTLFPFISNLTFSAHSSILQISFSKNIFISFIKIIFYLIGLVIGSTLFSGLWFWCFLQVKYFFYLHFVIKRSRYLAKWNTILTVLSVSLAVATIPYYSFHYLFLGPFGFMPEDRVFRNTIFTDSFVKDVAREISSLTHGEMMELKLFPFNTGDYLVYPEDPQTLSMEDLIYRSDFAWVRRMEKLTTDVVSGHTKGKKFSRALGLRKGGKEKSFSLRFLSKQTPLMTYRLDLNNKFEAEDIIKLNLDFEYNKKKKDKDLLNKNENLNKKKENMVNYDHLKRLPHDPILDRYFQWYDFENLQLSLSEYVFETTEINLENQEEEDIIYFFVRNLVQSPFLFVPGFIQNQRDVGYLHHDISFRIKQQYQQSRLFKLLIKADIGTFLNRQPKKWSLNGEHEYDLQAKRKIVTRYYDSLRSYAKIATKFSKIFKDFFGGSINLSNQIYNQQFTGTLRNITRFFSLTVDDEQNFSKSKILKYLELDKTNFNVTFKTIGLKGQPERKKDKPKISFESSNNKLNKKSKIIFKSSKIKGKGRFEPENNKEKLHFILEESSDMILNDLKLKKNLVSYQPENKKRELKFILEESSNMKLNGLLDRNLNNYLIFHIDDYLYEKLKDNLKDDLKDNLNRSLDDDLDYYLDEDLSGEVTIHEDELIDRNKPSSSYSDIELVHRPVSYAELENLKRTNITLKFDQPLYKFSKFDIGPELHEELYDFLGKKKKSKLKNFSMYDQICSPLYVDDTLTISNKMLTEDCSGVLLIPDDVKDYGEFDYNVNLIKNRLSALGYKYSKEKDKLLRERINSFNIVNWGAPPRNKMFSFLDNFVFFSCWPLHDHIIEKPFYEETIPYLIMKEYKEQVEFTEEDELTYDVFLLSEEDGLSFTRPWIMEYLLIDGVRDCTYLLNLFIPQKGGFVWPGIDDSYIPGIKRRMRRPLPDKRTARTSADFQDEEELSN